MTDEVIQALERQIGCYRRLAKLAEVQHGHVQQNQMEPLLEVLKSRQDMVEQIAKLEKVIGPARQNWGVFVRDMEVEKRSQAESYFAEAKQLLESITTNDQNDALLLQQRKLNLGKQINQASAARQVNRTYAAAAYGTRPSKMDMQR